MTADWVKQLRSPFPDPLVVTERSPGGADGDLPALLARFTVAVIEASADRTPLEAQDSADLLELLVRVHQISRAAERYADQLLIELRDPCRPNAPSLRKIGHRLGVHHTTVAERVQRIQGRVTVVTTDVTDLTPIYLTTDTHLEDGKWHCRYGDHVFGEWEYSTPLETLQAEAADLLRRDLRVTVVTWESLTAAADPHHDDPYYVAVTDPNAVADLERRGRGIKVVVDVCRAAGDRGVSIRQLREELTAAGIVTDRSVSDAVKIVNAAMNLDGPDRIQRPVQRGRFYLTGFGGTS